jgi:hypothetical protein
VKRASIWPALSPQANAGVEFYFLAFLAFFFFTMGTSCSSDIGNSEICLEPTTGTNSFLAELRVYFRIMDNSARSAPKEQPLSES